MNAPAARYARWKAPSEDGRTLIWPEAHELLADTHANRRRLSRCDVRVAGVPLREARARLREWLGHADDEQPIVATGHQTELHHPGVWVKNALIDAAAEKLEGRAFHFAVDTDEPKHLLVRWPGGSVPLTDDPNVSRGEWSGLVAPPTPAHLQRVEAELSAASAGWAFRPVAPQFLLALRRLSLESVNLPTALANSLHGLDWDLGLQYDAMMVSRVCGSEPYLLFVHHVLSRAGEFAADYNTALDEFRRANRVRTPGRPMPNLKADESTCEVPFWLDDLRDGTRRRAEVSRVEGVWTLEARGESFRFDPAGDGWESAARLLGWLRPRGLRLSPRALTLTAVLRLFVADQFVHGIGGGQYDQVLDALIARHFGIEPPRFSVTTATLFFPEAAHQSRVCLPCVIQESHQLKHAVLGERKMELVRQISELPRGSGERSSVFFRMHDQLLSAWAEESGRTWERKVREAEALAQEQKVIFDRELFYAIQPRERLVGVIDQYRDWFSASGAGSTGKN